jgi:hypothetical protein
VRLLGVV